MSCEVAVTGSFAGRGCPGVMACVLSVTHGLQAAQDWLSPDSMPGTERGAGKTVLCPVCVGMCHAGVVVI